MKKGFNLRIDESLKNALSEIAKLERRSLNQQIEKVLQDFADAANKPKVQENKHD